MKEMIPDGYAIVPDGRDHPVAVFAELDQAIEWALSHLGSNRFTIRAHPMTLAESCGPIRTAWRA